MAINGGTYANLAELRRYLALNASQTSDDGLLVWMLEAATRLIERYTVRRFMPRRSARVFDYCDSEIVLLDDDLLALESLTNGDGTAIALEAVRTLPDGQAVSSALRLDPAQAVFVPGGSPIETIGVTGLWGYHPDWDRAWWDSGDALVAPAEAGGSGLTVWQVSEADGSTPWGAGPRFAAGQLIRLGEEYAVVQSVDSVGNTISVVRGVGGTTVTTHAAGTAITLYAPPDDVRQVCLRVASWLYRQKDAGFVQTTLGLRGQIAVPAALPEDVQAILAPYVRLRVA